MRTVKPGQIVGTLNLKGSARKAKDGVRKDSKIKIWEDFDPKAKKVNKKKEYERGTANRMVPKDVKSSPRKEIKDEPFSLDNEESGYKPRDDFEILEESIGYNFKDKELLNRALTHRSALGLKDRADYERLEFLGDAVLDLSVAHLLSDKYPEAREGELSKMRAALVNTQALADIAKKLEIGPFIRLGRGEMSSGGADRPSILADVMEAVVGAMYRDSNFNDTLARIEEIIQDELLKVTPFDPKTELQEALHISGSEPPEYRLELVEGPEHAPTFITLVAVDGEIAGRGKGATKKASQQSAAAEALKKLTPTAETLPLKSGQSFFIFSPLCPNMMALEHDGEAQEVNAE